MLQAGNVANGFTRWVTTAQIAGVLLAQFAYTLSLPLLPHAPLKDCARHHCGCPAELTARKACCCFAGGKRDSSGVVGMWIRAAHCSGGPSTTASPISKLHWTLARAEESCHTDCVIEFVVVRAASFRTRTIEPLVPPPKFLLAV